MSAYLRTSKKEVDTLNGPLVPSIIQFAIPIAISNILQQLFNAADTTVVGRFAGADALAAVGTNGELVGLVVSVSSGLAIGANVLMARAVGEGRKEKMPEAIRTSLLFALVVGVLGMLIGVGCSQHILHLLNAPAAVFDQASAYLRIYFYGYPFLVLYDFSAAIFRGYGDSRRPFLVLMACGCVNVVLNLVFVLGFHLGVVGVAVATDIASLLSCCALFVMLFGRNGFYRRCREAAQSGTKPGINAGAGVRNSVKLILIIGVPAALQSAVFCFANLFVTASVNSFGELATSGSTISINYEYITYYVCTAFAQTATTFISQNSAAGKPDRCRTVLKYCLIFGVVSLAVMTVPITLFSRVFASVFSSEPDVLDMAVLRMRIMFPLEPLCGIYEVLAGAMRARGFSLQPAVAAMVGICSVRIAWIVIGFPYFHTLPLLFVVYPASWIVTSILMIVTYRLTCCQKSK